MPPLSRKPCNSIFDLDHLEQGASLSTQGLFYHLSYHHRNAKWKQEHLGLRFSCYLLFNNKGIAPLVVRQPDTPGHCMELHNACDVGLRYLSTGISTYSYRLVLNVDQQAKNSVLSEAFSSQQQQNASGKAISLKSFEKVFSPLLPLLGIEIEKRRNFFKPLLEKTTSHLETSLHLHPCDALVKELIRELRSRVDAIWDTAGKFDIGTVMKCWWFVKALVYLFENAEGWVGKSFDDVKEELGFGGGKILEVFARHL